MPIEPINLRKLQVYPLTERKSLTRAEEILLDPNREPPACSAQLNQTLDACVEKIRTAKKNGASIMLIYGAHLLRNGTAAILAKLMEKGWLTHLATNGAGTIHDWEYAWFGASTESVEMGVAGGTFGTWDETARNIHLALASGALSGLGYGRSLGRFIHENGTTVPSSDALKSAIANDPTHLLTPARADLLQAIQHGDWGTGHISVPHQFPHASILAQAYRLGVPVTVHPGIGYDIIANHPCFNGAILGRAADLDFRLFGGSVGKLDGGVVLSIGSAIMGPQVFEKSISCVNNLRLQAGHSVVSGHSIYVVDIQDGGNWDWSQGEPPKTNPAYYLRFCKSYSRMGGTMQYVQSDNAAFIQHLWHRLK
ncbi:MAG: hypothetical protein U0798_10835 [Gemmataceae bacterium]